MFDHGVHDQQQLAHAGDHGGEHGFAAGEQLLIVVLMIRLCRVATIVALYRLRRTWLRPPPIIRLPRKLPLSRLIGARPTSLAAWPRFIAPNSGSPAAVTAPPPGTLV